MKKADIEGKNSQIGNCFTINSHRRQAQKAATSAAKKLSTKTPGTKGKEDWRERGGKEASSKKLRVSPRFSVQATKGRLPDRLKQTWIRK